MTDFWELPATARFVRGIAEDIRAGNNIALTLPSLTPDGWLGALRGKIRQLNLHKLETIEPNGDKPLSSIAKFLGLGSELAFHRTGEFCERPEFQGRLLYVRVDCPRSWAAWRGFLREYEDACRKFDLAKRTLFVLSLHNELCADAPTPANLLRLHGWSGCVDSLNIRLYATALSGFDALPIWQRHLGVTVLSELALWDPTVCEAGASRGLQELIEPMPWLAELGSARSWAASDDIEGESAVWRGLRQPFEGRSRLHSCWLAIAGRETTLRHRVWNGQVASLFPLLERQRRALLRSHGGLLRVPWSTTCGQVDRIEDLELNHIADQMLSQRRGGLRDTYEFVCWLRDMRNQLAHLEPVPANCLLEPRFQDRLLREIASGED